MSFVEPGSLRPISSKKTLLSSKSSNSLISDSIPAANVMKLAPSFCIILTTDSTWLLDEITLFSSTLHTYRTGLAVINWSGFKYFSKLFLSKLADLIFFDVFN